MESLWIAVFSDASFANTDRLKSQLGFVVVLTDRKGNANILYYGSAKCRRVARSVMAAGLLAFVYAFDNDFVVRSMLEQILKKKVPIDAYLESRTVFNVVAKEGSTLEKRLQIDVKTLRESYAQGELRNITWIPARYPDRLQRSAFPGKAERGRRSNEGHGEKATTRCGY